MNFAISFLQLILVLALEIFVVFDTLRVLMVPIFNVSSGSAFVIRLGATLEVLVIILHIDISLRVSVPVPMRVRIHLANNIIFIV